MASCIMSEQSMLSPRESMRYDVVIVGAGPAGLAAAIRLKSLNSNISVVVVEKGSTIGAHILSGAVIDPIGLDQLTPDWRSDPECPLKTRVAADQFYYLTETRGMRLPNWAMPRLMSNHGNFIGSLGGIVRWLGARAEALGVEIYPGFAATDLLYGDKQEVVGIATGDMGVGRDGHPKAGFTRGMELFGKYILLAEGARGSVEAGDCSLRSRFRKRGAEVRNWSQRVVASLRQFVFVWPRSAHFRLAAVQRRERRLISVSLWRPVSFGRICGPSQLRKSDALTLRRIPALQDPSFGARCLCRGQTDRLWRARHRLRRLAVRTKIGLSRGSSHWLLGGLCELCPRKGLP